VDEDELVAGDSHPIAVAKTPRTSAVFEKKAFIESSKRQ
jgi:hypothetical protein